MPRKLSIEKLLSVASTDDPLCVEYLRNELALFEPSEEVVKALVEHDAERLLTPNDSGSTPIHTACGNIENVPHDLLMYLLVKSPQALAVPNKYGLLPLHKAVAAYTTKRSLPSIRAVAGAHTEGLLARTVDNQLPLHIALHSPKLYTVYVVELLLELEPSAARFADSHGQYPLHKAAGKTKIDPGVITVLLDAAGDVATMKDLNG
jgi:ankyrin repeat protein